MPVAVAEFQGVLAELARRLGTSLTQLLATFDRLEPAEQYAFITDAYPDLLLPYLVAVGEVTTQWYAEQPTTDDPALFVPEPAVLPETEALSITGRWALTTSDPLAALIAAATKSLFDQSRDTVLDNVEREGVKWARYASSTACGFCRMLATRGAVYTSQAAAGGVVGRSPSLTAGDRRAIAAGTLTAEQARANRSTYSSAKAAAKAGRSVGDAKVRRLRGNQQHGERYHRNCRCVATAVRAGDTYEPPDYVQQWEADYQAARKAAKTEGLTNKRGVPDPAAIAKLMDSAPGARRDPVKAASRAARPATGAAGASTGSSGGRPPNRRGPGGPPGGPGGPPPPPAGGSDHGPDRKWLHDSLAYVNGLTGRYRQHVIDYTGHGHRDINGWLRKPAGRTREADDYARSRTKSLDAVLAHNRLTRRTRLTRVVGMDAFGISNGADLEKLAGVQRVERGYLSTSRFQTYKMKDIKQPVVLDVIAPEGTPAAAIEEISAFGGQGEILLGRNLPYMIVNPVYDEQSNTWRATMLILGGGGS